MFLPAADEAAGLGDVAVDPLPAAGVVDEFAEPGEVVAGVGRLAEGPRSAAFPHPAISDITVRNIMATTTRGWRRQWTSLVDGPATRRLGELNTSTGVHSLKSSTNLIDNSVSV
jgi:hypothetical protein